MDALMGDEVCALPMFGAFVMTSDDAALIRAALRLNADTLIDAGNGRDAVPLAMLSKRLGEFIDDLRVNETTLLDAIRAGATLEVSVR